MNKKQKAVSNRKAAPSDRTFLPRIAPLRRAVTLSPPRRTPDGQHGGAAERRQRIRPRSGR